MIAIGAFAVYQTQVDAAGVPGNRLLAAGVDGVLVVSAVIAWVSGLVLAVRLGSLLWVLVVVLAGPLGSLACALLGPARGPAVPPGAPRR